MKKDDANISEITYLEKINKCESTRGVCNINYTKSNRDCYANPFQSVIVHKLNTKSMTAPFLPSPVKNDKSSIGKTDTFRLWGNASGNACDDHNQNEV